MAYVSELAAAMPVPPDYIYVHNFKEGDRPQALSLPAGQGRTLNVTLTRNYTFSVADKGDLTTDSGIQIGSSGASITYAAPFGVDWDNDGKLEIAFGTGPASPPPRSATARTPPPLASPGCNAPVRPGSSKTEAMPAH